MTDTLDAAGLAPCPFCGSRPILRETIEHYDSENGDAAGSFSCHFRIMCDLCGAEQSEEYRDDAIAAWNRRATPPVAPPAPTGDDVAGVPIGNLVHDYRAAFGAYMEAVARGDIPRPEKLPFDVEYHATAHALSVVFASLRDETVKVLEPARAAIAAYEAARETGLAETLCPECNRHIMENPEPACGFIASCGRRLTRLNECRADGCAAVPSPEQETRTP